jgi:molybdenum cofactor biosynthesis enzyme MoaA
MNKNSKSLCVLPWIHLATHPIGTVTPCCITDMTNNVSTAVDENGNQLFLSKNSLNDITNSVRFNQVRKEMLNGEFPSVCQRCYEYDSNRLLSKRMESNQKFPHLVDECFKNTNPDGSLKEVNYKYVELRLGTVCNLKCVTCNPFSSNRWNQDLEVFKGTEFERDYFRNEIKTEWYRDYNFYDELYAKCDGLEEVWINGGEPTMIREHGYFLDKFVKEGRSKGIDLHYSLNCTQFPDHFIELWKNFKRVRIHLSIDDLEERNFYIRFPSDWDQILKSFEKIVEYKNVFNLEVCQTVSTLNVHNINNFKKWVNSYGLIIAHNFVHWPEHMHVSLIPDEMKKEIKNNISNLAPHEKDRLIVELDKPKNPEKEKMFYRFVSLLDKQRNVNISNYLKEWEPYFKQLI